jgi:prepilin-type N-terminal cleavage/methylation domain-containing protein
MKDFTHLAKHRAGSRGFSLLELSLVILILGLMAPLLWRFIAAQTAQKAERASYSLLEAADWALTGYAMAHARLPCPDTNGDGKEDCGDGTETGKLPYKTLGLADARARWMRYGVLRRTSVVADPDPDTDPDWLAWPPRDADLAAAPQDRFYPFFAYLDGALPPADIPMLQTIAHINTPVLDGGAMVKSANVRLNHANSLDFCAMLRVAEDPPPDPATGHLNIDGRQLAYALALAEDAPGAAAAAFNPPTRSRAVSPSALWHRLECGEAIASIGHAHPNAATAALMLYRGLFDYEQVQQQAVELAETQVLIATSQVLSASAAIIDAVSASLHAAADVLKFGNALSVPAAVLMVGAAAVQAPLAGIGMASAVSARDMAEQRLVFLRRLRETAGELAEKVMLNAVAADERGVY